MDIAPRLAIFRSGQHTAVDGRTLNFTAADLQQIAASYDAANDGAPLVVGHPSLAAPAYGWAKSLSVEGDTLYAVPDQVDAQFAEMVNAGRFKKISSSVYLPDSPGNPKPGQLYLRHIGFLGAAAPAVKGLKAASFAATDVTFVEFSAPMPMPMSGFGATLARMFRTLRTHLASTSGADLGSILPDSDIESLETIPDDETAEAAAFAAHITTAEHTMSKETEQAAADFAEQKRKVDEQATALAAREKSLAERETKAHREDAVSFTEQLVTDGKLLPRDKAAIVELLLAMPPATAPLSFAEGEATVTKPGADVLRGFLTGLPKRIAYGREISADRHDSEAAASFAAPANMQVDPQRLELLAKARAWQGSHPNTSLIEAVRAVGG
ncbi:MAG: hypothetical protein ACYCZD_12815 [Rhodanobacter sp.]